MINTHWGGVTEDNSFGSHEFMDLCSQIGCEPYICGNVGSGTVQELSQWVEYMNFEGTCPMTDLRKKNGREAPFNVKFWCIGNEYWGCGGNMTPEYYADLFNWNVRITHPEGCRIITLLRMQTRYCQNHSPMRLYLAVLSV